MANQNLLAAACFQTKIAIARPERSTRGVWPANLLIVGQGRKRENVPLIERNVSYDTHR